MNSYATRSSGQIFRLFLPATIAAREGASDLTQIQNMQNAVATLERTLTKGPPRESRGWFGRRMRNLPTQNEKEIADFVCPQNAANTEVVWHYTPIVNRQR